MEVIWCGKVEAKCPSPRKTNVNPESMLSLRDSYGTKGLQGRWEQGGGRGGKLDWGGLCDFWAGPVMGKKTS